MDTISQGIDEQNEICWSKIKIMKVGLQTPRLTMIQRLYLPTLDACYRLGHKVASDAISRLTNTEKIRLDSVSSTERKIVGQQSISKESNR
jgi:hypothetical protein